MLYDAKSYIIFFLIYGFLGFLLETVFRSITGGKVFISRGFLTNGFCPLYGICGILIVEIFNLSELILTGKLLTLISATLASIIAVTFLEYITGRMLDRVFNFKLWDYNQNPLNLHSYICLEFSLLWGITAIILSNFIHPLIEMFVFAIPYNIRIPVSVAFLSVVFVNASYNLRLMSQRYYPRDSYNIPKYAFTERKLPH